MIPCIDIPATGKNIRDLIRGSDMTMSSLSFRIGVSPQAIYKWVVGKSLPTIDNLVFLAEVLGVSIEDILVVYHV